MAELLITGGTVSTGSLVFNSTGILTHTDGTLEIDGGTFDNGGGHLSTGSSNWESVAAFLERHDCLAGRTANRLHCR